MLQFRQVPLEERTTKWSHHAGRLLCQEDRLWSYAVLCCLSGGPLRRLVVPILTHLSRADSLGRPTSASGSIRSRCVRVCKLRSKSPHSGTSPHPTFFTCSARHSAMASYKLKITSHCKNNTSIVRKIKIQFSVFH